MTERRLEKRASVINEDNQESEVMKIYVPFMYLHDQFGYSVQSIYRRLNNESAVDLGVYPDTFPNNIAKYYWIDEGKPAVKSWKALGRLNSGLYFYYTAYCDGEDGDFKRAGNMNLWMVSRYGDLVQFAMDNEAYEAYMLATTAISQDE